MVVLKTNITCFYTFHVHIWVYMNLNRLLIALFRIIYSFNGFCCLIFRIVCVCAEYSHVIYSLPYKFSWRDAQDYCRLKSTDLVGIHSATEQQTALSFVSIDSVWIGLFSDDWKWSDGATSFFRFWGKST